MQPSESINQAFLQLTFAIKLLAYVELGKIRKDEFDTEVVVLMRKNNLHFEAATFKSYDDIILAAQNNYTITLGFSAIVMDRALSDAGFAHDLPSPSPCRDLRALVYMLRCAFAHDMMQPRWKAKGSFARELRVTLPSGNLVIDMCKLHDQPFDDSQIGGIEAYYKIKTEVERILTNTPVVRT